MTHPDPGGTPEAEAGSLTRTPTTPDQTQADADESPAAVPGTYEASDDDRRRGQAVKPGN